jgi:four helix bundle protein
MMNDDRRMMNEERPGEDLRKRTREFAVRVMRLVDELPKKASARGVGGQLVRCATSVGANYHIACRAGSKAEFIAKVGIVLEECDECLFWLQLIVDAGLMPARRIRALLQESDELTAIFTASAKTARGRA